MLNEYDRFPTAGVQWLQNGIETSWSWPCYSATFSTYDTKWKLCHGTWWHFPTEIYCDFVKPSRSSLFNKCIVRDLNKRLTELKTVRGPAFWPQMTSKIYESIIIAFSINFAFALWATYHRSPMFLYFQRFFLLKTLIRTKKILGRDHISPDRRQFR